MEANKVVLNKEVLIDLTEDTATAADVKQGKTFHTADGVKTTGTMEGGPFTDYTELDISSYFEGKTITETHTALLPNGTFLISVNGGWQYLYGTYIYRNGTFSKLTDDTVYGENSAFVVIGNKAIINCYSGGYRYAVLYDGETNELINPMIGSMRNTASYSKVSSSIVFDNFDSILNSNQGGGEYDNGTFYFEYSTNTFTKLSTAMNSPKDFVDFGTKVLLTQQNSLYLVDKTTKTYEIIGTQNSYSYMSNLLKMSDTECIGYCGYSSYGSGDLYVIDISAKTVTASSTNRDNIAAAIALTEDMALLVKGDGSGDAIWTYTISTSTLSSSLYSYDSYNYSSVTSIIRVTADKVLIGWIDGILVVSNANSTPSVVPVNANEAPGPYIWVRIDENRVAFGSDYISTTNGYGYGVYDARTGVMTVGTRDSGANNNRYNLLTKLPNNDLIISTNVTDATKIQYYATYKYDQALNTFSKLSDKVGINNLCATLSLIGSSIDGTLINYTTELTSKGYMLTNIQNTLTFNGGMVIDLNGNKTAFLSDNYTYLFNSNAVVGYTLNKLFVATLGN